MEEYLFSRLYVEFLWKLQLYIKYIVYKYQAHCFTEIINEIYLLINLICAYTYLFGLKQVWLERVESNLS